MFVKRKYSFKHFARSWCHGRTLIQHYCTGPHKYAFYHCLCIAAVAAHELSNLLHWYLIVEWQDPTFSNRYSVTHQKLVTALLQVRKQKSLVFDYQSLVR